MLFNGNSWDFFNDIKTYRGRKFLVLAAYNPIIQKCHIDQLIQDGQNWTTVLGSEVTESWVEENLLTPSLFSNNDHFKVLGGESISLGACKLISDNKTKMDSSLYIFCHNQTVFLNKLKKTTLTDDLCLIKEPPFWEAHRLLDFIADYKSMRLGFTVKNYLLENLEQGPESYLTALSILNLNIGDHVIDEKLPRVQSLVAFKKLDLFKLAELYGQKKFYDFFQEVLAIGEDFDSLRSFFSFMQGHLLKVLDPSYISKKKKASKYDLGIKRHSENWTREDLIKSMRKFSELEVDAKMKSRLLFNNLRMIHLKLLK